MASAGWQQTTIMQSNYIVARWLPCYVASAYHQQRKCTVQRLPRHNAAGSNPQKAGHKALQHPCSPNKHRKRHICNLESKSMQWQQLPQIKPSSQAKYPATVCIMQPSAHSMTRAHITIQHSHPRTEKQQDTPSRITRGADHSRPNYRQPRHSTPGTTACSMQQPSCWLHAPSLGW